MMARSQTRAFSLVELVIVVVIIGVIAAIAVPRISRGAKGAGDASLRGSLAGIRNAIDMYAAEHGGAFPASGAGDTETTLIDQLTKKSDASGDTSGGATNKIYGPYLRSGFPALPVCANKPSKTVKLVTGTPTPQLTGEGWVYSTDTGAFMANCAAGEKDESNVDYNTY
ncbi:MAG: prepilin-type N-terminal cleavage/methylation domain-containing protein [Phycisphaerae bacterium]